MQVAGDQFLPGARILAILWEGASSSGDTVLLVDRVTNEILWPGRTDSTQTYLGINFGPEGLHAPNGFKLQTISSGRVLVYLREN
jgi:hypothetical protein